MDRREYRRNLARSPLGIGLASCSVAAGAAAWLTSGSMIGAVAAPLAGLVLYAAALATGFGPKAAAAEAERAAWAESLSRLAAVKAARDRLASMRVPDAEVASAVALAAARASSYLAACHSSRSRDPRADSACDDCVRIADLYLKELDAAATERRHGLADADPFADAKARVLAELRDGIAVIDTASRSLSGGLSPADRMEIEESL